MKFTAQDRLENKLKKKFKKKLGILGGTFDPAHKGHIKISAEAKKKFRINKIIWAITKKNPFKKKSLFSLKERIKNHGVRHSLLVACMPTASTSNILGNTECFEPLSSNVFSRRTLMGEFIVSNKILVSKLQKLGLWTEEVQQQLMADRGSIQKIECIPDNIKKVFKTVWEISQKVLIDMAADRGPFVDQSQSLNLFLKSPEFNQVSSMHFYAWKKGLKTGIYYLRSQGAAHAEMFSVGSQFATQEQECEMCSA